MVELKPKIPVVHILALASSFVSLQVCFATQGVLWTPLLDKYNAPSWLSSLSTILASLFGLLQPIIGAISDISTIRFGRRRPFIILGTLLAMISFSIFLLLTKDVFTGNTRCIIIALAAFLTLALAENILMLPARALVADFVGHGQEDLGTDFIALATGIGNVISNLASAFAQQQAFIYDLAAMVVFVLPTLIVGREKPYVRKAGEKMVNPFVTTAKTLKTMVKGGPVLRASLVYSLSWWGYVYFMYNGSLFTATVVYRGEDSSSQTQNAMSSRTITFMTGVIAKSLVRGIDPNKPSRSLIVPNDSNATVTSATETTLTHALGMTPAFWVTGHAGLFVPGTALLSLATQQIKTVVQESIAADPSLYQLLTQKNTTYLTAGRALFNYIDERTPDEKKAAYNKGLMIGALAMLAQSLLCSVFSFLNKRVQAFMGLRATYFLAQALATICLFSLWIPVNIDSTYTWLIFLTYTLLGINFSQFNSVPFAILSRNIPSNEAGAYNGAMNVFCLAGQGIGQGVAAVLGSQLPEWSHDRHRHQWQFFAAVWPSIIATLASILLTDKASVSLQPDASEYRRVDTVSINADSDNNPDTAQLLSDTD